MPAHCAVVNCSDKYVHAGSISFHRFPFKRKDLLQQWINFTQRSGKWMPSKWSAVCSRHFVDADFNCCHNRKTLKKNAVPSVFLSGTEPQSLNVVVEQVVRRWQDKQTLSSAAVEATAPSGSSTKSTCRFCGGSALNCVSFEKSFELFGMIQKCFPTLQILQDDTLPKDICGECCKQLERFAQFIDVVMQAQSELQRKYRRQLKIKQEPIVRVKQEACESLDNLFPDEMDMGLDEGCCEHQDAADTTEQKFQFCDFPMLNAQDIINNCDIMEIINLDDPFINITDDAEPASQPVGDGGGTQVVLPTANEMLQAELLTEEHNYAKEEWQQLPYKTEKVEGAETDLMPSVAVPEPRSCKPIVTNVSQIPNPRLCELLPPPAQPPPAAPPTSLKPNIVVLNDSVVQSSAAFRLHNCSLCQAKFFTIESLNQHYALTHATPTLSPMVSVPSYPCNPLKLETTIATAPWQTDWQNTCTTPSASATKKKIDILDMQRSFLHHNDLIPAAPAPTVPVIPEPQADPQLAANYAKLAARYRRLQLKCQQLKHSAKRSASKPHRCTQCRQGFATLRQLLRHRRRKHQDVVQPKRRRRPFALKCCGCSKIFCSRLGLHQHMRYICQSLPLRSQRRLQSFKCRHCQAITFTHWRVYRRHELKCRSKVKTLKVPNPVKRRKALACHSQTTTYMCSVCQKPFGSLTGLRQHRITHTTERQHKCGICNRVFKRRNGLSQHIKGYHLQLKPHECPVCRHRYALKCDMLRCRHSQRRGGPTEVENSIPAK